MHKDIENLINKYLTFNIKKVKRAKPNSRGFAMFYEFGDYVIKRDKNSISIFKQECYSRVLRVFGFKHEDEVIKHAIFNLINKIVK